jgi:HJR/Mrr/RecB family endonuclease
MSEEREVKRKNSKLQKNCIQKAVASEELLC